MVRKRVWSKLNTTDGRSRRGREPIEQTVAHLVFPAAEAAPESGTLPIGEANQTALLILRPLAENPFSYGHLSREEALKICRENATNWLSGVVGSKYACVE
jgi:hypothetical protein